MQTQMLNDVACFRYLPELLNYILGTTFLILHGHFYGQYYSAWCGDIPFHDSGTSGWISIQVAYRLICGSVR